MKFQKAGLSCKDAAVLCPVSKACAKGRLDTRLDGEVRAGGTVGLRILPGFRFPISTARRRGVPMGATTWSL